MTAIENLLSILQHGLLSHNESHKLGLVIRDISDPEVNYGIRAKKRETIFDKFLHDYVPLYFSPRNPMLYKRKEIQKDLIILGINSQLISEKSTVFTDGNAASKATKFYNDIAMLDNLPWDIINANSWSEIEDGKRIKCSEALVYSRIAVKNIFKIHCYSKFQTATIQQIIKSIETPINISVQVQKKLFFEDKP